MTATIHALESPPRTLPHNLAVEQALLGAILLNNEAVHRVTEFLKAEHFYHPAHGRIYEAVCDRVRRGQPASPVTLKEWGEHEESLTELGGPKYLARLAGSAVTVSGAGGYGREIHGLYLRRALIGVCDAVSARAYDPGDSTPAGEQIEGAEARLFALAEHGAGADGGPEPLSAGLDTAVELTRLAMANDGRVSGLPTGFRDVDRLLGGLHASDLIVVAGRPSMGKTALALGIARHAIQCGYKVGFFSLEMSREQLAHRLLAPTLRIPANELRNGRITREQWSALTAARDDLYDAPLYIDDTPALSIAALRARARRLRRREGVELIIVDHLGLVRPVDTDSRQGRVQEVAEITRGLKAIAKDLGVPVLALSQLSRAVEQRDDKRPQLSDLRDSGTIEQDADVVGFLFRQEYYVKRREPRDGVGFEAWEQEMAQVRGKAELSVAKHRSGPTARLDLYFDERLAAFGDIQR